MLCREKFKEDLLTEFKRRCGEGYRLEWENVKKNNGVFIEGLVFHKDGSNVAPVIYIDSLYELYIEGKSVEYIVDKALARMKRDGKHIGTNYDELLNYELMKSKVIFQIINYDRNAQMLAEIPHKRFLDFGIVFRLYLGREEGIIISCLVNRRTFEAWGVSLDELYDRAVENISRLLPVRTANLNTVIFGWDEEEAELSSFFRPTLYLMTNDSGVNGASTILYPKALKNMADRLDSDLIIFPSSTHEVLLMKYDDAIGLKDYGEMVKLINQEDVPEQDILSDNVYIYRRDKGVIEVTESGQVCYVA